MDKRLVASGLGPAGETLEELQASLVASALGMEALMNLMAAAPAEHHVRTIALHALLQQVADQLEHAHDALRVATMPLPDPP